VKQKNQEKDMTEAEKEEVRRQRRLIKNREYAQNSRKKKKEEKVDQSSLLISLRTDNERLQARVKSLEQENHVLKDKLSKFTAIAGKVTSKPTLVFAVLFSLGLLFVMNGLGGFQLPSISSAVSTSRSSVPMHTGRVLQAVPESSSKAVHKGLAGSVLMPALSLFASSSKGPFAGALSALTHVARDASTAGKIIPNRTAAGGSLHCADGCAS